MLSASQPTELSLPPSSPAYTFYRHLNGLGESRSDVPSTLADLTQSVTACHARSLHLLLPANLSHQITPCLLVLGGRRVSLRKKLGRRGCEEGALRSPGHPSRSLRYLCFPLLLSPRTDRNLRPSGNRRRLHSRRTGPTRGYSYERRRSRRRCTINLEPWQWIEYTARRGGRQAVVCEARQAGEEALSVESERREEAEHDRGLQ